jgi:hypothetical protein
MDSAKQGEGEMSVRQEAPAISSNEQLTQIAGVLALFVGLGLAFQVGHFLEHGVQFLIWLSGKYEWVTATFCGRDTPFMSWPVTEAVRLAGAWLFPDTTIARQMMMGIELLHLVGNSIFLATIAGVLYFIPTKLVRYAFYIEAAHLCEHIALTITAYYVGKPIGVSTLFGQAAPWWGKEAAVGWRVTWHFVMNLLPMPFVMIAMMNEWTKRKEALAAWSAPA